MYLRHLVHVHLVVAQLREVHLQLTGHRGGLRIVTVILAHGVRERLIGINRLRGLRAVIRHRLDGEREPAILQRGTNQSLGHIDARVGTGGRIGVGKRGSTRHLPVGIRRRLLVVVRNRRGQLTGMRAVLDIGHCVRHCGRMVVIADAGLVRVGRPRLVHFERIHARPGKHKVARAERGGAHRVAGTCDLDLSRQIASLIGVGSLLLSNDLVFNRFHRGVIRWRQREIELVILLPRTPSQRLLHSNRCRHRLGHRVGVLERDISTRVRQLRAVGLPIRGRGGQLALVVERVLHHRVVHGGVVRHAARCRSIGISALRHLIHVGGVLVGSGERDLRESRNAATIVLRGRHAVGGHRRVVRTDRVAQVIELDGSSPHRAVGQAAQRLQLEGELARGKRVVARLVGIRLLRVK